MMQPFLFFYYAEGCQYNSIKVEWEHIMLYNALIVYRAVPVLSTAVLNIMTYNDD